MTESTIKTKAISSVNQGSALRRMLLTLAAGLMLTASILSAAMLSPSIKAEANSGNMRITPIDFGPDTWGDCTMVSSGGKNLLMDTTTSDKYDTITNYLNSHNYHSFDIYVSHYHYDHMYYVPSIMRDSRFHVSKVYLPDPAYIKKGASKNSYCDFNYDGYLAIVDAAKDMGIQIVYLKKGSSFTLGNAKVQVIWGCSYDNGIYDTHFINNNSLVTRVVSGDTVYLTAGDIEKPVENQLLSSGLNLRADIFKLSHHGGNTSNSAAFVKAVNPSFAFYNYNGDSPSSYGKSWAAESVANIKNIANVYSSRYNGMFSFSVKNGHISVAGERNMESYTAVIKNSAGKVVNRVTYMFNNADPHVITSRMKASAATVSAANATTKIPARIKTGTWKQASNGYWQYYNAAGTLVKNKFVTIDGKTYYLNGNGYRVTGWRQISKKWYYFQSNGQMLYRWKRVDGKKYLFDYLDGHMHTGWVQENGKWYYLHGTKGYLVSGWLTLDGVKYYMNEDFTMFKNGWKKIGGKMYHFDGYGRMQKGWLKVGSNTYYLGSDGAKVTGVKTIGGKQYTFNASGVLQGKAPAAAKTTTSTSTKTSTSTSTKTSTSTSTKTTTSTSTKTTTSSTKTSTSTAKKTGWVTTGGKTYYYDANGNKLLRWKRIDGKKYLLDPVDGHLHTGWTFAEDTGGWYYLDPANGGAMVYGAKKIEGRVYYFDTDNGKMAINRWVTTNGNRYFYDGYGRRLQKTGFQKINGSWYLLGTGGKMLTGWQTSGGKKYFMGKDGIMQKNSWINTNGYWFYVDSYGRMVTGKQTINGQSFTFSSKGVLSGLPPAVTQENTALWDKGTDPDRPYDVTTPRTQAFVNEMLTYATYFDGKISYGSSQNNTDPHNLRFERLRSGGTTDCSWFVYHVLYKYGLVGENFIHSYEWGNKPSCYPGAVNIGTDISKASPGDILCTGKGTKSQNSHVMIYLGNNMIVECAAGYGLQITPLWGGVRQIVHFKCLPTNPSGSFTKGNSNLSTGITTTKGSWVKDSKGYRYKVGSSYIKSRFYTIGMNTFYFDQNGYRKVGWQNIGKKRYYFDEKGVLLRRWKRIDGKKYLLDYVDGHLHYGWTFAQDTGGWYYLNPNGGAMMYGLQMIDGQQYYLNPSDGKMVKSIWVTVSGKRYHFNSYGICDKVQ